MTPLIASTEVACPADEAFAYVIDPRTMSEWQRNVVRGRLRRRSRRRGRRTVMTRPFVDRMFRLEHRLRHQVSSVLVGQPVEHPIPVLPARHRRGPNRLRCYWDRRTRTVANRS